LASIAGGIHWRGGFRYSGCVIYIATDGKLLRRNK
jgi:hypothetical protein